MGSALLVVVVYMTTHGNGNGQGKGQRDLFGDPAPNVPQRRGPSRIESNDVELMVTVAANAVRCGYLLVGASERVYARTDGADRVARVPRYEEDAVHQLLRRRWLKIGAAHLITCGAAHLVGTAVLVPKSTRDRIARWQQLQRPPSWPDQHRHPPRHSHHNDNGGGRLVHLDDYRRTP